MSETTSIREAETPRLYNVKQTAEILGSVSERFVWQLIHDGLLRTVKVGSRRLIRDDDLAHYIETCTESS